MKITKYLLLFLCILFGSFNISLSHPTKDAIPFFTAVCVNEFKDTLAYIELKNGKKINYKFTLASSTGFCAMCSEIWYFLSPGDTYDSCCKKWASTIYNNVKFVSIPNLH
ncbi:hypothetical protein BCR32DRAFT_330394 [Anaeromyces robustus]|uniref:Uncharacterized protein n=1 Tax=Anaeromyces robustus TaxID=1754192 RepID=A0A1Y1VVH5_9FUNG|nr:hypothetical protein BCR32DRAFT_330394 [Anaeromyces robustus]|eukprot:ORX65299.1 hypothetical protein BCR32DRAFT_330394 [Anaeromyces robustus]